MTPFAPHDDVVSRVRHEMRAQADRRLIRWEIAAALALWSACMARMPAGSNTG